jgi:hypothetical protein
MAPRLHNRPKTSIKMPGTHDEWHRLAVQALERAETLQDPRLNGLREAIGKGQSEPFLRKIGVVCQTDLHREFPLPPKP